jgi:hypothetical protein
MKKRCLTFLLICGGTAHVALWAQSNNAGTLTNDGGVIDNHPSWVNTVDGNYIGSNNGVFNHFGPGTSTFTNHGSYLATLGHTDIFMGPDATDGAQEIAGSKRPHFFNLELINGAGSPIYISNTEGIGIAGNLNFGNGITSTLRSLHNAAAIVFEAGSRYTNGDADDQHVNGYVSKIGNTAFVFPVGSGTDLRTVQISAPEPAAAHISVAWIPGNPDSTPDPSDATPLHDTKATESPIISISEIGQWDWISAVAPFNDITVTVSLPDVSKFAIADNLRLAGWNGTKWINLSASKNATGVTENSRLTGIIPAGSSITALSIGSTGVPLPVHLISFSAQPVEKARVLLSWQTASEHNNDYFQVEHSLDAKTFAAVGRVTGGGTVNGQKSEYTFLHEPSVPVGNHYYRLKQVDFDRSFAYSATRSANLGDPVTLVYPNPATDKINIEIADWNVAEGIDLFDASGKKVYQTNDKKPLLNIDSRFFPAGIYLLKIRYTNGSYADKKIAIAN